MTVDTDRLRAAALNATPGEWTRDRNDDLEIRAQNGWIVCRVRASHYGTAEDNAFVSGNAAHITTSSPTTIISLCDEVEKLRAENRTLVRIADQLCDDLRAHDPGLAKHRKDTARAALKGE